MTLDKITELYFVTGNKNKINIYNNLMRPGYNVNWFYPEQEIQELQVRSVKEVVKDKLEKAYKEFNNNKWLFVTDVGFYIPQLDNRPGALIKRETMQMGGDWGVWCDELKKDQPRDAYIQIIIAARNDKDYITIDNKVQGSVPLKSLKGSHGFDWDEIFVPKYHVLSFAQMAIEMKHRILFNQSIIEFKQLLNLNTIKGD